MSSVARVCALVVLAMFVMMGDGCKEAASPPPTGEQAQVPGKTAAATNRVDAWINVPSGCQQATGDLLKKLAQQYAGKIDVTVTDFGSPAGADKWQMAGLHCMTIQFNGQEAVTFPENGMDHTVVFQMPHGLLWEHEDLTAAFAALAAGKLHEATKDDVERATSPIHVNLHPRAATASAGGTTHGELYLGDALIARLYGSQGKLSPAARAAAAKKGIDTWTASDISPADLSVAKGPDGWGVYGNETLLMIATSADAKSYSADDPQTLAKLWMENVRKAVIEAVNAARKAHKPAK